MPRLLAPLPLVFPALVALGCDKAPYGGTFAATVQCAAEDAPVTIACAPSDDGTAGYRTASGNWLLNCGAENSGSGEAWAGVSLPSDASTGPLDPATAVAQAACPYTGPVGDEYEGAEMHNVGVDGTFTLDAVEPDDSGGGRIAGSFAAADASLVGSFDVTVNGVDAEP